MTDLPRCLGVLAEPPGPETARIAQLLDLPGVPEGWEYTAIFLEQLYPYASVYLDSTGMMGGDARDRIAGFWRALGDTPPPEPDHLGTLLGAYANLAEAATTESGARSAALVRARAAFFWEHLLSWLPVWLAKLAAIGSPTYVAWGRTLSAWLGAEAALLDLPTELPAHLRAVEALERPSDDADAFIGALLSPARTGFILTPTDLAAVAEDAGAVLRAGERRYALKALLAQDAAATLQGLADLAARPPEIEGSIGAHWRQRATTSAALLGDLARDARPGGP
jgi:TorA maturation chaperone TorD